MSRRLRGPPSSADELDRAISALISGILQKPEDPELCIPALSRGLVVLKSGPLWETQFRTQFHELLNAVTAFLSYPINDEAFSAIKNRWSSQCSCRKDDWLVERLHVPLPGRTPTYTFAHVINSLVGIICQVTEDITPGKLDAGSSKKKWPKSFGALLPNGPVNLIHSTVRLSKLTMSELPTQTMSTFMIANILSFCPSVLTPLLDSVGLRECVASQLHNIVQGARSRVSEPPRFPEYQESIYHINCFIGSLGRASNVKQVEEYWRPFALQMYLDIVALLPLMRSRIEFPDPRKKDHLIQCFLTHGLFMHSIIPESTVDIPPLHASMAKKVEKEMFSLPIILYKEMRMFRELNECSGPDCYRTAEYSTVPMQKCSGCGLLRYCSKACQRSHWTWKTAKHKVACPELARVLVIFKEVTSEGGDTQDVATERYNLFAQELETSGFTEDDILMLINSLDETQEAREDMHSSRALTKV